jgi:hypothetical protein
MSILGKNGQYILVSFPPPPPYASVTHYCPPACHNEGHFT